MANIKELESAIEFLRKIAKNTKIDDCESRYNCLVAIKALQEKLERENRIPNIELLNRLDCIYNAKKIGYSDFLALRSIVEENDLHEQEQDKRQQGCECCRNPRKQWTYLEKSDKYCKNCSRDLRQSKEKN